MLRLLFSCTVSNRPLISVKRITSRSLLKGFTSVTAGIVRASNVVTAVDVPWFRATSVYCPFEDALFPPCSRTCADVASACASRLTMRARLVMAYVTISFRPAPIKMFRTAYSRSNQESTCGSGSGPTGMVLGIASYPTMRSTSSTRSALSSISTRYVGTVTCILLLCSSGITVKPSQVNASTTSCCVTLTAVNHSTSSVENEMVRGCGGAG